MSFLFEDPNLLETLFKIAQQNDPQFTRLQNLATKLINNLKQDYNSVKYSGSLTASDLGSLSNLGSWLQKNNALFKEQPIVDEKGGIDPDGLKQFLSDLQSKSQDLYQKELVANLINKANKEMQLGLNPYTSTQPDEKQQLQDKTKQEQKSTEVKPGEVAEKQQKEKQQQDSQTLQQQQQQTSVIIGTIFNGQHIDLPRILDALKNIVKQAHNFVAEGKLRGDVAFTLDAHIASIENAMNEYQTFAQGNPNAVNFNLPATSATTQDLLNRFNSIFNPSLDPQKAEFSTIKLKRAAYSLQVIMNNIINFLSALMAIPLFSSNWSEMIEHQMKMAQTYSQIFGRFVQLR